MAAGVGCRHYRDIDIAGSVNSQAGRMVEFRGEGALCAIGRVFGDGMFVRQKEISGWVKSQRTGIGADGKQDCSQAGNYQGDEFFNHKRYRLSAPVPSSKCSNSIMRS